MIDLLSDGLMLLGAVLLIGGAYFVSLPVGIAVTGLILLAFGIGIDPDRGRPRKE